MKMIDLKIPQQLYKAILPTLLLVMSSVAVSTEKKPICRKTNQTKRICRLLPDATWPY